MILEDHLHHVWPRTGINFNFLPLFSLQEPSVTHLVSEEDIELRSAEPPLLAARLQPPSGLDLGWIQRLQRQCRTTNCSAIIHYLQLVDIYFTGPADLQRLLSYYLLITY